MSGVSLGVTGTQTLLRSISVGGASLASPSFHLCNAKQLPLKSTNTVQESTVKVCGLLNMHPLENSQMSTTNGTKVQYYYTALSLIGILKENQNRSSRTKKLQPQKSVTACKRSRYAFIKPTV